jgi:phosphoenolpyruvate carboxylase
LLKIDPEPNLIHQALVRALHKLLEREDHSAISEIISQAARERKFLG